PGSIGTCSSGRAMLRPSMTNRLPYARAFVVQFTSNTEVTLERAEGRVEQAAAGFASPLPRSCWHPLHTSSPTSRRTRAAGVMASREPPQGDGCAPTLDDRARPSRDRGQRCRPALSRRCPRRRSGRRNRAQDPVPKDAGGQDAGGHGQGHSRLSEHQEGWLHRRRPVRNGDALRRRPTRRSPAGGGAGGLLRDVFHERRRAPLRRPSGRGRSVVVVDAGKAKTLTTTTARADVYAFIYGQKGLMAGLGLQGSKITKTSP